MLLIRISTDHVGISFNQENVFQNFPLLMYVIILVAWAGSR